MLVPAPGQPGAGVLASPALERLPRLTHGFTTRILGSATPGLEPVERALGTRMAGWRPWSLEQVHGPGVVTIGDGLGVRPGDALVTAQPSQLLVIRTADCAAIVLAALREGRVGAVGVAHAGWRGLLAGILPATMAAMASACPGARIVAAVGPTLGACCFEVGEDVATPFEERWGSEVVRRTGTARPHADLALAVRRDLESAGVFLPDPQAPPCTRCNESLFFSYRRDGAAAGRHAAFVGIRAA